jgi:hypothetical protein
LINLGLDSMSVAQNIFQIYKDVIEHKKLKNEGS